MLRNIELLINIIGFLIVWLEKLNENKISLSLERMEKFIIDRGKTKYKCIHVGGTNGKGSVCHFIYNILREDHKVGLYTSPHLERLNERIVIDGIEISNDEIEKYKYLTRYNFTYFEALTAIAIEHFENRDVDYGVFEVGLGGRLDATNVIEPEISIITNVSLEHENFLGKDIVSIAREKAGIIKNSPVVTACKGEALELIKNVAEEKNVELYVVGRDVKWEKIGNKFLIDADEKYSVETKMQGIFQGENIAIAIKAGELLGIDKEKIIDGIKKTFLPGRMEKIGNFILDGCHNPAAIEAFSKSIVDYNKLIIIFGAMRDKNIPEMIKRLPKARAYIATKSSSERAMPAGEIAGVGAKNGVSFIVKEEVGEAISFAEEIANKNEVICIIGSLYLVGEARKIMREKNYL
ncbi:MAG: bifunctional folylpolyglutamate synthase/dihydrofolate synthase [Thermoplasmatales archaeon]|nr:bifunctional folylpolyglutamate synthase/dihydrofolate synthase [Thermoplasmatales archaeon]